eukprot:704788-Hanusia_phi.AAC.1
MDYIVTTCGEKKEEKVKYRYSLSMLDIYDEKVTDLFDPPHEKKVKPRRSSPSLSSPSVLLSTSSSLPSPPLPSLPLLSDLSDLLSHCPHSPHPPIRSEKERTAPTSKAASGNQCSAARRWRKKEEEDRGGIDVVSQAQARLQEALQGRKVKLDLLSFHLTLLLLPPLLCHSPQSLLLPLLPLVTDPQVCFTAMNSTSSRSHTICMFRVSRDEARPLLAAAMA